MIFPQIFFDFFYKKTVAAFFSVVIILFLLFFNNSFSQTLGDFRTSASGNWNGAAVWQTYNGTTWVATVQNPTSASGVITIQSGHSIDLNINITLDNLNINSGGTINILAGDSLNIIHSSTLDFISNGTISGAGNIFLGPNSVTNIIGGTISGTGTFIIPTSSYLAFNGTTVTMSRNISNSGTVSWTSGNVNSAFTLDNNGVFQDSTSAGYQWAMSMNNNATFNKYISSSINIFTASFLNKGVVNINAGSVNFNAPSGTYNHTGIFSVASGALLQFGSSSPATHNILATISGAGNITNSSKLKFAVSSTYNISGTTTLASDTANFPAGMTLTNLGNITSTGGMLNLNPGLIVSSYGSTVNLSGGGVLNFNTGQSFTFSSVTANAFIQGTDTIKITTSFSCGSGTYSGAGPLVFQAGCNSAFNNTVINFNKNIFNNGTVTWTTGNIFGTGTFSNNNIFNSQTIAGYSFGMIFTNNGTLNKSSVVNLNNFDNSFTNNGTVNITTGTLSFNGAAGPYNHTGNFNISSGAMLQFAQNGTTHNIQSMIAGAGNVTFSARIKFAVTSTYNISGTSFFNSDSAIFPAGMTLTNIGTINNGGGVLNLKPGLVIGSYGTNMTIALGGVVILNTGITTFTFTSITSNYNILGTDTVKISSTFTCGGGTYTGNGALILQAGCTASFSNNSFFCDKNLFNFGTINWISGNLQGAGSITNNNIFNVVTPAGSLVAINFINNGTFTKNTNNNTNQFSGGFTNNGAININAGTIALVIAAGTFTHTGSFTVASGATLQLGNGGTPVHNIQSSISGAGSVIFAAIVRFSSSSIYNISGTSNIVGDTVTFNSGMTLTNLGTINCTGGVANFNLGLVIGAYNPTVTLQNGVLNFNTGTPVIFTNLNTSGNINGSDTVKITGTFTWSGGTYTGTGPIVMMPGCSTLINQFNITCDKNVFSNGTVLWTTGSIFGAGTFINNNVYNIQTTLAYTQGLAFVNNGTITKSVTNNRNYFNLGFTNSGTVNINTGTVAFIAPTGTYNHTGNFFVASGAIMEFGSAATATHNIQSSISGAGTVNFYNIVNFTASSTYNISGTTVFIAGTTSFTGGMTLTNLGTFSSTGGTANFNAGLTIGAYNPAINITGGGTLNFSTGKTITFTTLTSDAFITGSDTINVSSIFNFNGGSISGAGPMVIFPAAALVIASGSITINKLLINNGTINWSVGQINGTGTLTNNNIFNVATPLGYNCGAVCINNGTITKNLPSSSSFTNTLNNNSIINIAAGTLGVSTGTNNGTINISSTSTLLVTSTYNSPSVINVAANSFVTGLGTLVYSASSLINNGAISVTIIQFNGTTTLSGTGNITSTTFGVLNGGNVTLGSNHQLAFLTISIGGTMNISTYTLFINGSGIPIFNSGSFITSNGIVEYNGTNSQFVAAANITYGNLSINNSAGVTMQNKFVIPGTVYFTNGNLNITDTLVMLNGTTINRKNGSASGNLRLGTNMNIIYSGTNNISTGIEIPAASSLGKLTVNDPAGITLTNPFTANDTISVLSGFLNLNGKIITLASTGYLVETPGNTLRGTSGSITTTRILSGIANLNVGGLGAAISSAANMGNTVITRSHTVQNVNGGNSITRYYDITPTNNSSLNATVIFKYDNTELNSLNENVLSLYKSINSGANWSFQGGTRDTANNTISLSGINSFSRWTASVNSLATNLNVTVIPEGLYNSGTNSLNAKDSITIYLADVASPTVFIDSSKTTIDSLTFLAAAQFGSTPTGTYYIVVKHRSSLTTWSKSGGETYTSGSTIAYNFTSTNSQAFGNNENLHNGKYTLISGDVNQDGFVNGNDFTIFSQQYAQSGYLRADLNGDGVVNGNDFTIFSASFGKQYQHP